MSGRAVFRGEPEFAIDELQVRLLGPPSVVWKGVPFMLPRRQARALLYYLVSTVGLIARDHLCLLFWPDITESLARCNLNRLVSILRRSLPDPALLISSGDQLGLLHEHILSDTRAFNQLWADWSAGGKPSCLQQALTLYRGSFLDGFSLPNAGEYEAWITTERQRWERLALQVLAALIESETSQGEYSSAIAHALHYLEIDDLNEQIQRQLIELHALAGDRAAATRQYERFVALLQRELGVDPLPETQAIYRAVQAGGAPRRMDLALPLLKAPLSFPEVPLVGRAAAWRALEEAYARVRGGRGQVILISGEAGIGKTRLAHDFCVSVERQSVLMVGAGYPETQTSPYQPVVEALRSWLSANPFSLEANPEWLVEASRLLPELRALHPASPQSPEHDPGWARARLFESLAMVLVTLSAGARPVLLCLDDLHWADPATLDWLAYLGRHLAMQRVMILGAYRSEEATAISELRNRLAHQGLLREITLAGLDERDVYQLLCHFSAGFCDHVALAGRMHVATGGNPFFLLETARTLIESGQRPGRPMQAEDMALPDSVRSAVQGRVQRLSPAARQVLETAAVLGPAFDFATMRLISGRQEDEAVAALEELLARQLLTIQENRYRFRHDLTREAIYLDLSYHRRRLLHLRAGETLEKVNPDDGVTLVRHFELAEQPGRAARHALQAGLAARRVYAHVEARLWGDRALALLERELSSLRDPQAVAANMRGRIEALNLRGWALRLIGDMAAYARDLDEEGKLAQQLGDAHALAHLRQRQAYVQRWFCQYTQALEVAEDGVHLSQTAGDNWLEGMCWREAGLAARALGEFGRAESALQRALELIDPSKRAELSVHLLGNLSTTCLCEGDARRALELAQQALAVCDQAQLALERRVPLGDMGAAAAALGEPALARRCLEESLAIARQASDRSQEILCLGHLGWLEVHEGAPGAAREHLAAALALAEEIDSRAEQSWLHAGLAQTLKSAGERVTAVAHAQRALALALASGCPQDQKLARETLQKLL